ncbi:hypothetical protein KY361_03890 [Candidatus Woesearchaeota archaeon]|nr:hypothetical protein [Candidatus Woesearchaeota archaeon]
MRIIKSKRSSLNISINAIVIIVLAMTFLGLGLGFVRNMFGGITETTFTVQDQIKQQILDDLRTGDKKLSFPTNELQIVHGDAKVLAIGIKNTEVSALNFEIDIKYIPASGAAEEILPGTPKDIVIGSETKTLGAFVWDSTTQILGTNEASVYPIKFTAGATTGTYIVKIQVAKAGDSGTGEYASKSFFITIT